MHATDLSDVYTEQNLNEENHRCVDKIYPQCVFRTFPQCEAVCGIIALGTA
jgi:hypothetical protein